MRKPIAKALHSFGDNRMQRGGKLFEYSNPERIKSHIFSQEQYFFSEEEVYALVKNQTAVSITEEVVSKNRKLTAIEKQSFFDLKNYLPEELLVKTDRASMQYSLEVRVPLLDHRLVEFAINLSPKLKLNGQTGKYLLKQLLYDYVPESFFERPKWGFALPLSIWLKKELRYLPEKYLSKQTIEECNLVHYEIADNIVKEYFAGKNYLFNKVWALILLHKWYKEKHL